MAHSLIVGVLYSWKTDFMTLTCMVDICVRKRLLAAWVDGDSGSPAAEEDLGEDGLSCDSSASKSTILSRYSVVS